MSAKPPESNRPLTYRDAGVDIDAQDEALRRIKDSVASTRTTGVLSELGSFGGLFRVDSSGMDRPILVSSCDGIGTKLKLAFDTGIHDTVGRDLVNHCVDDILVQGARPLFFLDYVATGRLEPGVLATVVEGIARGCREAGCALLGGETAEMPGFYKDGEYDVAGFLVGIVDEKKLIDGKRIRPGHRLIGLPSAGLHTNGYSLARKIFFEVAGAGIYQRIDELEATPADLLLAEHRSYLEPLSRPVDEGWIDGLAHITGGGLSDNIGRVLPEGTAVSIRRDSWPVPPVFPYMQRLGQVSAPEMYRTFNMGIGMVAIVAPDEAVLLGGHLDKLGEPYHLIGEVVEGDRDVNYV